MALLDALADAIDRIPFRLLVSGCNRAEGEEEELERFSSVVSPVIFSTSLDLNLSHNKKNVQLAGHCLAVASWLTHLRHHFMSSYWIGFLVRFWFSFRIAGKGERERRSL